MNSGRKTSRIARRNSTKKAAGAPAIKAREMPDAIRTTKALAVKSRHHRMMDTPTGTALGSRPTLLTEASDSPTKIRSKSPASAAAAPISAAISEQHQSSE